MRRSQGNHPRLLPDSYGLLTYWMRTSFAVALKLPVFMRQK